MVRGRMEESRRSEYRRFWWEKEWIQIQEKKPGWGENRIILFKSRRNWLVDYRFGILIIISWFQMRGFCISHIMKSFSLLSRSTDNFNFTILLSFIKRFLPFSTGMGPGAGTGWWEGEGNNILSREVWIVWKVWKARAPNFCNKQQIGKIISSSKSFTKK